MQSQASSSNTSAKRKIKNVINGHIDIKIRAKHDTYYIRSEALILNAEEIDNLTGCVVQLETLPTWPRGATNWNVTEKCQEVQDSFIYQFSSTTHL